MVGKVDLVKINTINKDTLINRGMKEYEIIQEPNSRTIHSKETMLKMENNIIKKLMKFEGSVRIKGLIQLLSHISEVERKMVDLDVLYKGLQLEHEIENVELIEKLNNKGGKWNGEDS